MLSISLTAGRSPQKWEESPKMGGVPKNFLKGGNSIFFTETAQELIFGRKICLTSRRGNWQRKQFFEHLLSSNFYGIDITQDLNYLKNIYETVSFMKLKIAREF